MSPPSRIARRLLRPPLGALLLTCLVGLSPALPRAHAQSRAADAAPPASVAYHLSALFTDGPQAGTTLDGAVAGTLDSTGALMATLTLTTGITATVTGTLPGAGGGAMLILAGPAGNATLKGTAGKGGKLAGSMAQAGGTAVGSWLLTAETVTHSYAFNATMSAGKDAGAVTGGTVTIAATSDRTGTFDAVVALDDGNGGSTTVAGHGWLDRGNLHLVFSMPGGGTFVGVATPSIKKIRGGSPFTYFSGWFVGPAAGASGSWYAAQGS